FKTSNGHFHKTSNMLLWAMSILLLTSIGAIAQEDWPYFDLSNDGTVPDGFAPAREALSAPPAPGGITYPVSPALQTNFLALADDFSRYLPDTQGAVGPDHLMVMLNSGVAVQTRGGTVV